MRLATLLFSLGMVSVLVSPASSATDPVLACRAAKVKAVAKLYASRAKCEATAIVQATTVDAECLAKADEKFAAAIVKADADGACEGVASTLAADTSACIDALVDDVSPVPCASTSQSCVVSGVPACCAGLTCVNTETGPTGFTCQ